jgi:uncharacterized membrane-anchored protein
MNFRSLLVGVFLLAVPALASAASPDPMARLAQARQIANGLTYQQGNITLKDGLATIQLQPNFRYLNPADTEAVLSKIWSNPPLAKAPLGMLVPAGFDPLSADSWAVIISYDEDGHVADDDATKINYDTLLTQMKEGTREASQQRVQQGYKAIELVGWAAPPRYDAATHKMYWAKEIKFGESDEHTLNYNIRILGRQGVLVLNAVATMPQLAMVEQATPDILSMVNFKDGSRYADFNPSTDKLATYGLAALVAGGIAAKAGLFKVLWVGLLAAKKFVIMGLVALGAFFKRVWAKMSGKQTTGGR